MRTLPRGRIQGAGNRKIRMTIPDDWKKTIHRNKLLGMWAAEKLGITGRDAEAYSDALAVGTLDLERSDVLSKIRKDFDAAGVVQSDEQILRVMNEFTLQAGMAGLTLALVATVGWMGLLGYVAIKLL